MRHATSSQHHQAEGSELERLVTVHDSGWVGEANAKERQCKTGAEHHSLVHHNLAAAIGTERVPQLHHSLNHAGADGQPLQLPTKMLHNKPHPHPDSAEHADAGSTDWTPKNGNPCHQQIQWPSMVHPVLVERTDDDRAKHTTEHVSGMQQPQSCMLQLDSRTGMRAGPGGT